ncbi:unnamed protein product [Didymodactylos carnosus]|uniref:ABC1 atypical kinase-like domain-containing protein n=1 Tax=Didymodactylos carnosus TaxID=1234261 RepID=A0A813YEP3_9BILA|nr:unnamed protein product [Didymodactylos carnosus]CAF0883159.1 unnamed protein product [Didymodactylos carnosus]CAF3535603.1 unnamed protein product [Didymodactylos carnosus]CAF3668930.1 unnamed protein product [Didymodactylos carnosus]
MFYGRKTDSQRKNDISIVMEVEHSPIYPFDNYSQENHSFSNKSFVNERFNNHYTNSLSKSNPKCETTIQTGLNETTPNVHLLQSLMAYANSFQLDSSVGLSLHDNEYTNRKSCTRRRAQSHSFENTLSFRNKSFDDLSNNNNKRRPVASLKKRCLSTEEKLDNVTHRQHVSSTTDPQFCFSTIKMTPSLTQLPFDDHKNMTGGTSVEWGYLTDADLYVESYDFKTPANEYFNIPTTSHIDQSNKAYFQHLNALSNMTNTIPMMPDNESVTTIDNDLTCTNLPSPIRHKQQQVPSSSWITNIQQEHTNNSLESDTSSPIIIHRNTKDYVIKQDVAIRFLRPPTPPLSGPIIIREIREKSTRIPSPIIIQEGSVNSKTPSPIIFRERPPEPPEVKRTHIIYKHIPAKRSQRPPIIIERLPILPIRKPPPIVIEKWLPYPEQKRKVIYEKASPTSKKPRSKKFIIEYKNMNVIVDKVVRHIDGINKTDPTTYVKQHAGKLHSNDSLDELLENVVEVSNCTKMIFLNACYRNLNRVKTLHLSNREVIIALKRPTLFINRRYLHNNPLLKQQRPSLRRYKRYTLLTVIGVGVPLVYLIYTRKWFSFFNRKVFDNENENNSIESVSQDELDSLGNQTEQILNNELYSTDSFTFLVSIRLFFRTIKLVMIFTPVLIFYYVQLYLFPSLYDKWCTTLKHSFEYCGPCFIKLGQWMATRPDLFSAKFCEIFNQLHSNAPQHSTKETYKLLKENNINVNDKNQTNFLKSPLASGAIAQVYRCNVKNFDCIMKVRHPNVQREIYYDLKILNSLTSLLTKVISKKTFQWLNIEDNIQSFTKNMLLQTNLLIEAKNLEIFERNFEKYARNIRFPHLYKQLPLTKDILFQSYEDGLLLNDFVKQCQDQRIRKRLAYLGVNAFLKMLFVDNFVHADLHPGNILVRLEDEKVPLNSTLPPSRKEPVIILLDVGLISSLKRKDKKNFYDLFRCIVNYDGEQAAQLMMERAPNASMIDEQSKIGFRRDMSKLIEQVLNTPLKQLEVGIILKTVLDLGKQYQVKMDSNFTTIALGTIIIEGMGRQLDPDFDFVAAARPYLQKDFTLVQAYLNGLFKRNSMAAVNLKKDILIKLLALNRFNVDFQSSTGILTGISKVAKVGVLRLVSDKVVFVLCDKMFGGGVSMYTELEPNRFFDSYTMEGLSIESNEIYMEITFDDIVRAFKTAQNAKSFKIRLMKKNGAPCLTIDAEVTSISLTSRQLTCDIPIHLIARKNWNDFREPSMPNYEVRRIPIHLKYYT